MRFQFTTVLLMTCLAVGCHSSDSTDSNSTGQTQNGTDTVPEVKPTSAAPIATEPSETTAAVDQQTEPPSPPMDSIFEHIDSQSAVVMRVDVAKIMGEKLVRDMLARVMVADSKFDAVRGFESIHNDYGIHARRLNQILISATPEQVASLETALKNFILEARLRLGYLGKLLLPESKLNEESIAQEELNNQHEPVSVLFDFLDTADVSQLSKVKQTLEHSVSIAATNLSPTRLLISSSKSGRPATVQSGNESLATLITGLGEADFAMAVDAKKFITVLREHHSIKENFGRKMMVESFSKLNTVSFKLDLQADPFCHAEFVAENEISAKMIHDSLQNSYQVMKRSYQKKKTAWPVSYQLLIDDFVEQGRFTIQDKRVIFQISRPEKMDKLMTLLIPDLLSSNKKANRVQQRNDFKALGLAFWNFHGGGKHFPAPDSYGDEERHSAGLSWRVHLLPFLDESGLYQQFNFDEPWDSEHNRQLIKQMPEVFGNRRDFKTPVQVLLGEGTPFQMGKPGPDPQKLPQPTRTFLLIRAGESEAEIWTKPGGIEYDQNDPIGSLGITDEQFLAMFFDGFARWYPSSLDPETMGKLIRADQGGDVELPD